MLFFGAAKITIFFVLQKPTFLLLKEFINYKYNALII